VIGKLSVFLASAFYLSFVPAKIIQYTYLKKKKWTGAGFVGSVWGALTYLYLPAAFAESWVLIVVGIFVSVLVSHLAEQVLQVHDDPRIVIDEWIGAWIALFGLGQGFSAPVLLAFVLFRVFDSLKGPWGNRLQKLPGGWGITMDDVMAGILANGVTRLAMLIFPLDTFHFPY